MSRSAWGQSLALHGVLLLCALALFFQFRFFPSTNLIEQEIEVLQYPQLAPRVSMETAIPKPAPPPPPSKSVFGVSRNAITASGSDSAAEIKSGNTVAKEMDNEKLDKDDATSLPIPADEFLVSSMPVLEKEIRIPYPSEAREKKVEGPVVMDLLIDDKGTVRQALLVSGPGFGLNEAALQAIQQFRFRPARIQDRSVAVRIRYTYRFILESR